MFKLDNSLFRITIRDNAGGIPEEIINKIFDPYFTTKQQSQGTGLGLYMSYEIITDHFKGKLYAKNETVTLNEQEYMGAAFCIEFERLTKTNI
ncbi:MAG: hypothetical protein HY307_04770 [Arcobacter sp.]|nr:hypothetical protein [Arcobacter sp.]